ncbi:MAG: hydrogenase formation protein HypD [Proteobacteria bacterium]|nr:hydrogenase formation protein HypD [Pseudomonadota bacterium]
MNPDIFKDKELVKKTLNALKKKVEKLENIRLMEFCGTHTHNIFQYGFRNAFLPHIRFIAGPGCPVCVTSEEDLAEVKFLFDNYDVGIIAYGDLLKVPLKGKSLLDYRAEGRPVEVVYSAIDAVKIAENKKDKEWVFLGVGFETTTPGTSASIMIAEKKGIKNLSYLSFHKNTKAVLKALGTLGNLYADGVILPGHVSAVVGYNYFREIEKFGIPAVVVGFEPLDLLAGISELIDMILKKEVGIKCAYPRAVNERGNEKMLRAIEDTFDTIDAYWRGLGIIENGGYELKNFYDGFNARKKYSIPKELPVDKEKGCRCGDVLIGRIEPTDCPLFKKVCSPANPIGPCMVSYEGTCLAYYKWGVENQRLD